MRIQSLLNIPELLSANNSSVCRRSEKVYGYGLSNYEASLYSPRKLVSPTGWSKCEPRVAWTILRWFIDKTFWNHSPVRGSVVSVDLELLHSIHAFQGAESLQINPLIYKCCRLKMFSCPHCVILLTCSGTLLDPVTNCRNLALSVWSKLLSARQNLNTNIAKLRWFSGRCVCWHSPDDLEAGGAVLVVLGVGLQVVNVDVRQTRQQQLQLLLVEDGNKSAIMTLYL